MLQFDRDIVTLSISEPKIADAVVVSPREVMVNAKATGQTTLVVWETGAPAARYNIKVVRDEVESQALRASLETDLKAALSDADIQFSGNAASPQQLLLPRAAGRPWLDLHWQTQESPPCSRPPW